MDDRLDRTATAPLLLFAKLVTKNGSEPVIRAFFPTTYDESQLHIVKKYAFPFDLSKGIAGLLPQETFTFMITRESGKYNFGYCLIENNFALNESVVYCILSTQPWKKAFYDTLRHLVKQPARETARILKLLHEGPMPHANQPITIVQDRLYLGPPQVRPNSISSDEYYQMYMLKKSMDPLLLIELFVSLLFERRIILRSSSLGTLTDVCSAIESLLYPFKWQGIYIIPLHVEMLDYCHAPTPYLIGVHSSIYTRLLEEVGTSIADDDISIFDIDSKAFYSGTKDEDLAAIPKKIMKELENNLKNWEHFAGREIKEAFITCQARLLANYTRGFLGDGASAFAKDAFVNSHHDPSMRDFAERIIQVQMFEQFATMKETMRARHQGHDAFDTVIRNLPELKSKLDDAKKFMGGLLDRGRREMAKKRENVKIEHKFERNLPQRTQSTQVIVTKELFDISAPTSVEQQRTRPNRPPPPRPASVAVTPSLNLVDNFSLINEWSNLTVSTPATTTTLTNNNGPGEEKQHTWLHSNIKPEKPKSVLDEFDPLA